jgi:hypothetical protein
MPAKPMPLNDLLRLFAQIDAKLSELRRRLPLIYDEVGRSQGEGHHDTPPAFAVQVRPLKSKSYTFAGHIDSDGAN